MRSLPRRLRDAAVLAALPLALAVDPLGLAAGEERVEVVVPAAAGLVLDGTPDEAAWADAPRLEAGEVVVPFPPAGAPGRGAVRRAIRPQVRVLAAAGHLWLALAVPEPPGVGMGASILLRAGAGAGARDAVAVAYAPQDVRSPRYVVRGPRGTGRGAYPLRGAAGVQAPDRWSLEIAFPLSSLALGAADTPVALSLAVRTRTPSHLAWAPPGAAFRGPSTGPAFLLRPAGAEGWPAPGSADPPVEPLLAEDARDADRLLAWRRFAEAYEWTPVDMLAQTGVFDGSPDAAGPEALAEAGRRALVVPLEEVSALRPDLAFAHVVRGHVLNDLGLEEAALEAFATARDLVPGLREAEAGAWLGVRGPALARGTAGQPTRYAAAYQRAQEALGDAAGVIAQDGVALGRALLDYFQGELAMAAETLDRLAARYPHEPGIVLAAERARRAAKAWQREEQVRARESENGDLPRVRFETTRGEVLLELFEDDMPNTVRHLMWLVRHRFYDDKVFDWSLPFLGVGGGERGASADSHPAGPGYAIAAEVPSASGKNGERPSTRRRPLFRGTITMISADPGAVGAAFLITTGTALHLDRSFAALGRVVAGQNAVDAMAPGDRIVRAEVVRARAGTEYRPLTADGTPAPEPR